MEASTTAGLMTNYQILNGQVDTLISLLSLFATAFGVIVAVVIAFFAIRQLNVDREIRQYRNEIRQQKELMVEDVAKIKKQLTDAESWADEKKKEIEMQLEKLEKKANGKQSTKELEKLKVEIEELKEDVVFRRGALSVGPGGFGGSYVNSVPYHGMFNGSHNSVAWYSNNQTCKGCGRSYSAPSSIESISIDGISKTKCPYCGNIN